MKHINYCKKCNKYTMKQYCCETSTTSVKPPRYLQSETIKKYRRKAKQELLIIS